MTTHQGNALRRNLLESKTSCRMVFSSLRGKAWLTLILFGALTTLIVYAAFYLTGYYMYLGLQERIVSNTRLHTIALIEHRIQQFQVCITHQTTLVTNQSHHDLHRAHQTAYSGTWTSTRQRTCSRLTRFTTTFMRE